MISKKSLVPVLDKSIILIITAPNDNAKSISVQCGGGHFAGMPMVADVRGVGVKNHENLPTS